MVVLPQATPLLLTKRLNTFLNANQTPELPTLLLTTSHGKLLAHASSQPVSVLRTHTTVAAALLAIHTSSSVALPTALPGSAEPDPPVHAASSAHNSQDGDGDGKESTARGTINDGELDDDENNGGSRNSNRQKPTSKQKRQQQQHGRHAASQSSQLQQKEKKLQTPSSPPSEGDDGSAATPSNSVKPVTITVQLSGGIVIIRRLKCGLLLVCVGPSTQKQDKHAAQSSSTATPTAATPTTTTTTPPSASGTATTLPASAVGAADSTTSTQVGSSNSSTGSVAAVAQALESADLLRTPTVASTTTTTAVSAETESLASVGGETVGTAASGADVVDAVASTSVVAMRRQAGELARWLDDKLATLTVPDDITGID